MDTQIFAVIGIGVVAAVMAVSLRQTKPEYAMLVALAAGIFITYKIFSDLVPIMAQMESIVASSPVSGEYAQILFKSLGICMLTQIACDACKDAGEGAIAAKIEMAGRVCVLAVSLPLFTQVLSIVYSLMQ